MPVAELPGFPPQLDGDPLVTEADAGLGQFTGQIALDSIFGRAALVSLARAGETDHRTGSSLRDRAALAQIARYSSHSGRFQSLLSSDALHHLSNQGKVWYQALELPVLFFELREAS